MTIDDMIDVLMEKRSQLSGNTEIVIADQSSRRLFCRSIEIDTKTVYGQNHYENFSDSPISGDEPLKVVVFFRKSRT